MKVKKSFILAWLLFAVITVIVLYNLVVDLLNLPADSDLLTEANSLLLAPAAIAFAFLGTLILTRQPRNVIGWLIMTPAIASVLDSISISYLEQFPTAPNHLTVPLFLAVFLNNLLWLALIYPLFFIMLLFPDGRPPSPRWRWVMVAALGMIAFLVGFGLISSEITLVNDSDWAIKNPIGLLPLDIEFPMVIWSLGLVAITLSCLAAPFVRYRRAVGIEREQIKWLFYGCGLFALSYIPGVAMANIDTDLANIQALLFFLTILAIPATITIAILRYKLYDINVIIRKTLVYAVLTGLLAMVYLGTVIILQSIFEVITGQQSAITIVISTLIIAAIFQPLRKRVQSIIDRRFYRRKYDTAQTLQRFSAAARDEVDLDLLTAELLAVVQQSVEPDQVSLLLLEREKQRSSV